MAAQCVIILTLDTYCLVYLSYHIAEVPEQYRWPLRLKRKQKQRHQLYESPPKQSFLTSSAIDTVALSPTVNFVEHEEHDAHSPITTTTQPKACTC